MQPPLQPANNEERREFQRLRLDPPLRAVFSATPVSIVEAGVLGARIQHSADLEVTRGELRFAYGESRIAMRCEVVRTMPLESPRNGATLVSGLRFVSAIGESGDHLRAMLADLVGRALEHRYDSAATILRLRTFDGDKSVRGSDAHFVTYRLENGAWLRRPVFLPEQPAAGFTVARVEDNDEMRRLCEVYAASDAEGRRLIRLFAELSVSDALQIPPPA